MYRAPLKDLNFVLEHVLGTGSLSSYPGYEEYSTELAASVLEEAAKFAENILDPLYKSGDRDGAKWTPDGVVTAAGFKAAYAQYVEGGWPSLRAPAHFGGQAAPTLLGTAVEEFWGGSNLGFKLCPMLTQGAIEALMTAGSDALKDKFLPRMVDAAALRLPVRLEAVDGNGLLPMRLVEQAYPTAYAFRRFLQVELPERLPAFPSTDPLDADGAAGATIPDEVSSRWPRAAPELLAASPAALRSLPIDHGVPPVADARGGSVAGRAVLSSFIGERLQRYLERSNPDADGSSGLSPWIHFGQVSTHEIFRALARHEAWKPARLGAGCQGKRRASGE